MRDKITAAAIRDKIMAAIRDKFTAIRDKIEAIRDKIEAIQDKITAVQAAIQDKIVAIRVKIVKGGQTGLQCVDMYICIIHVLCMVYKPI